MKKIPDNARLAFKGFLFDVYHWDQKMFDGTTAVYEALRKREVVSVIAIVGEKIIINNEEQPFIPAFISLPGGLSELDTPDMLENAKRELLEETGYESHDWNLWLILDGMDHIKIESNNNLFIARNCQKVSNQKLDPGEKIENILVTFEEFLELRNNPKFRNKDLCKKLVEIAQNEEEKQKLKELFFGSANT